MLVIPAVDIRGGKCVRLTQGRADRQQVFSDDPGAAARRWQDEGAEFLHVVDLDGAFEGGPRHRDIIADIARSLAIPVEVGGGIRTREAVAWYLECGVERVILGTRALMADDWFQALCREFPRRIAAGVDAKDGMVATHGWLKVSAVSALDLADRLALLPLSAVIFTDISKDGMMQGPNLGSTREFAERARVPVIASGGISTLDDVRAVARLPVAGMVIGRALYAGTIALPDAIRVARNPHAPAPT